MDTRTRTQSLGLTRSELRVALTLVGINAVPELRPIEATQAAAR